MIMGEKMASEMILDTDSEYDSQYESDDSQDLDDEAKKARQQYLNELSNSNRSASHQSRKGIDASVVRWVTCLGIVVR